MKKVWRIGVLVLLLLLSASFVCAQERGTKDEARALLKKAVALIKAEGPEKAFPQLQDPNGKYVVKDLYVYVFDAKEGGALRAHPKTPGMIGRSWTGLKDADGKDFTKAMLDGVTAKGGGIVDYRWSNPGTKKVESKSAYYEKVGSYVAVCGYYR